MGSIVRLSGLVVALCVASSAVAKQPEANPPARAASAVAIDPRWGVLGEVAERDFSTKNLFTLGTETIVAFRWVVPNEEMELHYLGPTRSKERLKLDPASGEITRSWKALLGTTKVTLQTNSAGDIVWAGTTNEVMFLRKNSDGTYWVRWDPDNKQTLTPVDASNAALMKKLADAGIEPGRAGLNRIVVAGAAAAPAPLAAKAVSIAAPAGPAAAPQAPFEFLDEGVYALGRIAERGKTVCYLMETTPGQLVQVGATGRNGFDPAIMIGAGSNCDAKFRMYGRNDNYQGGTSDAIIPFVAGGGTYTVLVYGSRGTTGDFGVRFKPNAGATRKMPPGMNIPRIVQPQFAAGVSASTAPLSGNPVPAAGTNFKDCAECPELVVIKPGTFFMGSSAEEDGHQANEGPRHQVKIRQPFAIGKYEVTFAEWDACVIDQGCARNPQDNGWGRGRRPVLSITRDDAMQYVRWLRRKTGQNYYLPSEAEWEYAARAGTTTPWNTGSAIITDDANILNALGRTVPVGGYPANAFGVHDMHGNATEWTADCYEIGYFGTPNDGSAMTSPGCRMWVLRGGSFVDAPSLQRSARRFPYAADTGAGFRIARAL